MQQSQDFYKRQLSLHQTQVAKLFKTLSLLSLLRLAVFLLTVTGVYYNFQKWNYALGIALLGTVVFLLLLTRYTAIKSQRKLHQQLIAINKKELKIASGDFHSFDDGANYLDPNHAYNTDIDLFGRGSFFQYINRTGLAEGTNTLAGYLNSNSTDEIINKQEAIKELANDPEWTQNYTAMALILHEEERPADIVNWLSNYKPFLKPFHRLLAMVFGLGSLLLFILFFSEIIAVEIIGYWLLFGLGITSIFLKRVNGLAFRSSKAKDLIRQYSKLLLEIEQRPFTAKLLKSYQDQIAKEGESASTIFKQFSKALDALDHRNNLIAAVLGNGFFLWDIMQAYRIERWIHNYGSLAKEWFAVVAEFDAYNTLGIFAFNHQDFSYPNIINSEDMVKVKALGHPLIIEDKRICSDFEIKDQQFFIITGANMAGKSTFLRAVALHNVMANMGLPVCAKESKYKPIKLISSMRTSDSLADESSYFFSELTRLKLIVETLKKERYFVILDEILKGTNSTDKAKGSKKFVERLLALKASGIIATHDLSLTALDQSQPLVKNYFFDADIKDDELYFDYRLKEGVCQNMNASFLLRKMDIVK